MIKKALYPGSFDPFTNGHLDIVKKSAALFDEVYVLIGINSSKKRATDGELMKKAIEHTVAEKGYTNVKVLVYDGLIAAFAKDNHIKYMIRGLRNNMDYNYEENIAEVNKLIDPEMEYVYFRADNVAVSSSMVKELYTYGQDVSSFLPKAVYDVMNNAAR